MTKKTISLAISIPLFVAFALFAGVLIMQNMQKDTKATMPKALQQEASAPVPTIASQKAQEKEFEDLNKTLDSTADDGGAKELDSLTKDIDSL